MPRSRRLRLSRTLVFIPALVFALFARASVVHADGIVDTFDNLSAWQVIFNGGNGVLANGQLRFSYGWGEVRRSVLVAEPSTVELNVMVCNCQTNTIGWGAPTADRYVVRLGDQVIDTREIHGWRLVQLTYQTTIPNQVVIVGLGGQDVGFWGGWYGPVMDDLALSLQGTATSTTTPESSVPESTLPETSTTSTQPATTSSSPTSTEAPTTTLEESDTTTSTALASTTTTTVDRPAPTQPAPQPAPVPQTTTTTEASTTTTTSEPPTTTTSTVVQTTQPETTTTTHTTITPTTTQTTSTTLESTTTAQPELPTPTTLTPTPPPDLTNQQVLEQILTPSTLTALSTSQAEQIFAELDETAVTPEQAELIVEALADAPDEVKKAFQDNVNVFSGIWSSYKMVGQTITVAERVVLITVANTMGAASAVLRRREKE